MQTRQDAFDAHGVVGFLRVLLRVLLRKLRGQVLVIWDGSPLHNGQPVKDLRARRRPAGAPGTLARLCA